MGDYEEVIQKYYNKYISQSCTEIHDFSVLAYQGSLFYVPTTWMYLLPLCRKHFLKTWNAYKLIHANKKGAFKAGTFTSSWFTEWKHIQSLPFRATGSKFKVLQNLTPFVFLFFFYGLHNNTQHFSISFATGVTNRNREKNKFLTSLQITVTPFLFFAVALCISCQDLFQSWLMEWPEYNRRRRIVFFQKIFHS